MSSRRTARIAEAIRETVSTAILFQLRDPRIQNVTVTKVEVAADVRTAKVYVSIMGTDKAQKRCLHGLNSARGLLQGKVGDRLQTRYTPVLTFVVDEGVKKSIEVSRLLREALPPLADPLAEEHHVDNAEAGGAAEQTDARSDCAADDLSDAESHSNVQDGDNDHAEQATARDGE